MAKPQIFANGPAGRPALSDGGRSGDGYFCDTKSDLREAATWRARGIAHQRQALGYTVAGPGTDATANNLGRTGGRDRSGRTMADEGLYRNEAFNAFGNPGAPNTRIRSSHQGPATIRSNMRPKRV